MDPSFHRALSEGFLLTHDDDQLTEPACKSDTPLYNPSYVPSCHLSPKTDTDMPEHLDQASITFVDYIKSPDGGEIKDSDDRELYIIFLTQRHVKDRSAKLHLSLSLFNCYGDSDRGLVSHMEQSQNKRKVSDDVHVFTFSQDHRQYVVIDLKESTRQIAEITINNDIPNKVMNLAHVYLRRDWLLPNETFQKFLLPLASTVSEKKHVNLLDVYSAYIRPLSQIPVNNETRYQHADMGLYFDKNSAQSDLTDVIKINSQSSQRFSNENNELSKSALVEIETQTIEPVKQNSDKEAQISPLTEDASTEMNCDESEIDKEIEKRTQDVACEANEFVEEKEEQNVAKLLVNSEIQTEYGILGEISKEDKDTYTTTDLLDAGRRELSEKEVQTIQEVKENIDKEVQFSPLTLEIGIEAQIDPDYDSSAKENRGVQDFGCQVENNSGMLDVPEDFEDLNNMQGLKSNTSLVEKETQTLEVENQRKEKKAQVWCLSQDVETQTTDTILEEHRAEFGEITKDYLSTLYLKTMMKQILNSVSIAMATKEKEGDNEQYKTEQLEKKQQTDIKAILVTPPNNLLSTDISEVGTKVADEEISQLQTRVGSKKVISKSKKELLAILKRLTFSLKVERLLGLPKITNHDFANAIIQCFLNTPLLWPYFYRDSHLRDIKSKCEGNLARVFGQLVKKTRSCLRNCEELLVLTQSLLSCISERAQKIGMNVQGDDKALTTILLQGLNSDLTREAQEPVCRKLNFTPQNENSLRQKADKSFDDMLSKSNSIITDLFCGQLLKITRCANCGFQSTESELFCTLPLVMKERESLDQAFNEFTKEKHLQSIKIEDVSCPNHTLIGKTMIWRLPEVLILNLEGHQDKETVFHLNKTLDVANFVKDSDDKSVEEAKYILYGAVSYNQTLETYSADCLSAYDKKWYCYRDEEVTESYLFGQTINEDRTIKALFYVKSSNFPRNDSRFIDRVIWHS